MVFQNLEKRVGKIVVPVMGLVFTLQPGIAEASTKRKVKQSVSDRVQDDEEHKLAKKFIREGELDKWEYNGFVGYEKTVKDKELLMNIKETYGNFVSGDIISTVLYCLAQESSFDIETKHKNREKGTGGFRKCRADELVKMMKDSENILYFPHYDFSDYDFNQLDDYDKHDLNFLLKAADVVHRGNQLKEKEVNINLVYEKMKKKGFKEETYKVLDLFPITDDMGEEEKKEQRMKEENMIKECINTWEQYADEFKGTVVLYAATNGGLGAIKRAQEKEPSAQLVYNAVRGIFNNALYFRDYQELLPPL